MVKLAKADLQNYYTESAAHGVSYAPLSRDMTVETCVIGGGLAGLNVALELAEAGHEVALVEANTIGWGASGRNGGFVSPGYALGAEGLVKAVGAEHARKLYNLTFEAMDLIKARYTAFNLPPETRVDGMLKLSLKAMPQTMGETANWLHKTLGVELQHWTADKVAENIKSPIYGEGLHYSQAFHMHPLNYARGLAWQATALGAHIFENSPVGHVQEHANAHVVALKNGHFIKAKNIVYACSGYIGGLNRRLQYSVVPVATYVMSTNVLGDQLNDAIRVPYCILDSRFTQDYYRKLPCGRLLWGGRVSMFEPSSEKIAKLLMHDLQRVYPQLEGVEAEHAWGGIMGYARHKMPQIGKLEDGVWYCTAFGGHGLSATTAGGRAVAHGILGANKNWELFKPFGLRFTGGPLVAPTVKQVMYWGYQALDQLTFLRGRLQK